MCKPLLDLCGAHKEIFLIINEKIDESLEVYSLSVYYKLN